MVVALQNPYKITYGGHEFIHLDLIPFALRYEILIKKIVKERSQKEQEEEQMQRPKIIYGQPFGDG